MSTHAYSDLFACIYDQPAPIGSFGRGAHYSVFRSVQWRDRDGDFTDSVRVHDFVVIWDEDHDRRVISVVQSLQMAGLMWPVLFVGERKGGLTLAIDPRADFDRHQPHWEETVRDIVTHSVPDDDWRLDVGNWSGTSFGQTDACVTDIIADDENDVWHYLGAIAALWRIGREQKSVRQQITLSYDDLRQMGIDVYPPPEEENCKASPKS
ncbi:MAG: hypothetical protein K2X31_03255 [Sphingopyxis sp.]|nr:hypothetical protein [Sphingopyxis sp.]